jgi:nitrous oxidase accessory protein NosD
MTNQHPHHDPGRLERSLRVWLTEGRPPLADREAHIHSVLDALDDTPRTRARLLGRWIDRGTGGRRRADAHDHLPKPNRRSTFMLSATGLTAAFAILALTINVIDADPVTPSQAGTTHSVAADGSGDFTTIQAAVDAADPGDTISIQPGAYSEAISIDKDITLTGDGPREAVVLSSAAGGLPAITLHDTEATVTSFAVSGDDAHVRVEGGAPLIKDVAFAAAQPPDVGHPLTFAMLAIAGGSRAQVVDNDFAGAGILSVDDGSEPLIEGNRFVGGPYLVIDSAGPDAVIRGNVVRDSVYAGITIGSGGPLLIEDNEIVGAALGGIVGWGTGGELVPTIRGNHIADNDTGISLPPGTRGRIEDNVLEDNEVAITLRSNVDVADNEILGNGTGVIALRGSAPAISGNSIDVLGRGIVAMNGSSPIIEGNEVCGGDAAIWLATDATPKLGTNDAC